MPHLDPTYLRYIYDNLIKGSVHPDNASELPDGLIGLYEEAFEEHLPLQQRQKLLKRFAIWALLMKEVSAAFVAEVLGETEEDIQEFISTYSAWFTSPESGKYQLYHERFRVYVLQKLSEVEIHALHEKLIVRLEQAIQEQKADEFERYGLEFLAIDKYVKAKFLGDKNEFNQFALNSEIWERQREISNDFLWSKKMIGHSIKLSIEGEGQGLPESVFGLLTINLKEQNEYDEILRLVKNNEFDLCLQRLHFFGGKSFQSGKRRFLLMLKIIEELLENSMELSEKKKFSIAFLQFAEEQVSSEKYLFNWIDFLPSSIVLNVITQLLKIDIFPIALVNKTNKFEFNNDCDAYVNEGNFAKLIELIENSNWTVLDKYSSKLSLCELAIRPQVNSQQMKELLFELLDQVTIIQNNIGSKLKLSQLVGLFLRAKLFKEILGSSFFHSEEFEGILIETITLHLIERHLIEDDFFQLLRKRFKNTSKLELIDEMINYILPTSQMSEISLFDKGKLQGSIHRFRIVFQVYLFLKYDHNSKADLYWNQLISAIENEIKSTNSIPKSLDIISIFESLLQQDCQDEMRQLLLIFFNYFDDELILKLISKVNHHNGQILSEILLKKKEVLIRDFFEEDFLNALVHFCQGDFVTSSLYIELIDNVLHKDFLFKLLLIHNENQQKLVRAYLNFSYSVTKVNSMDSKVHLEALKFLEEQKSIGGGKLDLFELKQRVEQSSKKPLHFFQFSQNEYMYQITELYIKKGKWQAAEKIQKIVKNPSIDDLFLFQLTKDLVENKNSVIELKIIDDFKLVKSQWLAQHFIAKVQYQRDDNFKGAVDTISKIDLLTKRIQGYFNCIEISFEKNDSQEKMLFDLIESSFRKFGNGNLYENGKDKYGRLTLLTTNSLLLIKLQQYDFLINQLSKYKIKDRFLAYLKIAELAQKNQDVEIAKKFFLRVYKQLDKLTSSTHEVEVRCEIIQLCAILKYNAALKENISYLQQIVLNCTEEKVKSQYALKIITSFLKIKRFKQSHDFFIYLTNPEDILELVRFIGKHFNSNLRAIYLSELKIFVKSTRSLQELIKSKINKLRIDQFKTEVLQYSFFIQDDIDTLYKLLTGWFLNEVFFDNRPIDKLSEYAQKLKLQWAIDIKNQLPN